VLATVLGCVAVVRVRTDLEATVRIRYRHVTWTGWLVPGCYPNCTYTHGFSARLEPDHGYNFTVHTSLAVIECLSSDCILTWSVCELCSSSRSFTSRFQICDPTDNHWVAAKWGQVVREISGFSIATQRILVGLQLWNREVNERLELHNLRTDHVMIRSELRYLIGTKVVMLKCWVCGGNTGPIATVRVYLR